MEILFVTFQIYFGEEVKIKFLKINITRKIFFKKFFYYGPKKSLVYKFPFWEVKVPIFTMNLIKSLIVNLQVGSHLDIFLLSYTP